jgi:hypothetical protein
MRKLLLSTGIVLMSCSVLMAQDKKSKKERKQEKEKMEAAAKTAPVVSAAPAAPATSLVIDDLAFTDVSHDFGNIPEGPDAQHIFTFKNNGKEPIIIQKAQPSCGCTVPSFSSEPVPPGGTGKIDVAYHTKGRPNAFTKSITVVSNAGTKVLTIKGSVEKAPVSSVPENNSMMKTN